MVKGQLPDSGFVRVEWLKMNYNKTLKIEQHPSPREGWQRQFHSKPKRYADEKEWRLQIRFLHSFRIQNYTLKFRWPSVGHCFDVSIV